MLHVNIDQIYHQLFKYKTKRKNEYEKKEVINLILDVQYFKFDFYVKKSYQPALACVIFSSILWSLHMIHDSFPKKVQFCQGTLTVWLVIIH